MRNIVESRFEIAIFWNAQRAPKRAHPRRIALTSFARASRMFPKAVDFRSGMLTSVESRLLRDYTEGIGGDLDARRLFTEINIY